MPRKDWLAAIALLFALAGDAQGTATLAPRLDAAVRAEVPRGFSGAVLVARGNRILLDRAYGAERGVAMRTTTKFWIASGGKQFVSAAILKCRDLGWLTLEDPLSRFFPGAPADKRAITVRQLLAHLSGFGQGYEAEGAANRDVAVARMLAVPLIDQPGAKFHYANNNYELAAAIVEVASGIDYHSFARTRLFSRVPLHGTGFSGTALARGVAPARELTPPRLAVESWGDAGVFSTTHDLFTWYRALRAGRVLSPRSAAELFTPVTPIEEGQAALGWFVGKTAKGTDFVFTRGNDDFGANALLYAYPQSGIVIVVLTHAGMANDDLSWSRLVQHKLEAVLGL